MFANSLTYEQSVANAKKAGGDPAVLSSLASGYAKDPTQFAPAGTPQIPYAPTTPAKTGGTTATPSSTGGTPTPYYPRGTGTDTGNGIKTANDILAPVAPRSEAEIYQSEVTQRQAEIDAINAKFDSFIGSQSQTNKETESEANAIARASGQAGSPDAYTGIKKSIDLGQNAIDKINAERSTEIQSLFGKISESAKAQAKTESDTAKATAKDYIATQEAHAKQIMQGLGQKGIDIETLKTQNPDEYQQLLNVYNGDENAMNADYIANLPAESIIGSPITSGNNLTYLSKDPRTGAIKTTTIDAGVDLTADKDITAHSITGVGIALVNKRTGEAKIIGGTAPKLKGSTGATSAQAKSDVQDAISQFQTKMKTNNWAGVNPDDFQTMSDYLQETYGTQAVGQLKTEMKKVGLEIDTTHK